MKPSETVEELAKALAKFEFPRKEHELIVAYEVTIIRFLFDRNLTIVERKNEV